MNSSSKNTRLYLALFHLVLGVLLLSGFVVKIYSTFIFFWGLSVIINTRNKNNEAMYFSAYMVGAEVLFRMAGGMIFYELPKYSVLLFLLLGLIVEKRNHHISITYVFYILLLLIGIAFVDIPFDESVRKAIAFNLSGPISLGVAAIYFYRRRIDYNEILDMLFMMLLPIISMVSLLYFRTPDFSDINFSGQASFEASGGYGPNQVATILGTGMFIAAAHLYFKKRMFFWLIADVVFFTYLVFRGLITFSRGGMITGVAALLIFSFFYLASRRNFVKNLIKFVGLVSLFSLSIWVYTANLTGGMLVNRYTNKNSMGIEKTDIFTGRIDLFVSEVEAFIDHPFFGIGVGGSKFYRMEEMNVEAASHNEVSRLLSEHGAVGILALLILILFPLVHGLFQPTVNKAFIGAFYVFWFLTINHSAMRIAFPGFIYGLSLLVLYKPKIEKETKEEENYVGKSEL